MFLVIFYRSKNYNPGLRRESLRMFTNCAKLVPMSLLLLHNYQIVLHHLRVGYYLTYLPAYGGSKRRKDR